MAIKFYVGKIPVEADTPAEAAALLRELAGDESGRRPVDKHSGVQDGKQEELKMLFEFLAAIRTGGAQGATSKVVAHALGVKEKGIGSRLTWVRTMLNGFHFDDKDVFARVKVPREGSFWKQGEKFDAAYDAVRVKAMR